jgi:Anti-sigma-K factor rskA, C-terminal/Sigma-70, region 4
MSPVERLEPSQRAVLQLVLQQGKSYDEIADMLGLDTDAVRARAIAALEALGPSSTGLTGPRRAEIADYLLSQQTVSEREATRSYLASSAAARAWARSVAGELRPLAGEDLPDIPDEAPEAAADEDEGSGEPLREETPRRSSRLGGILLLIGVAAVAAVVVILLVSGGSSDNGTTKTSTSASSPATSSTPTQTGPQPTPIAQVNLRAADGSKAVGVAQVLAQGNQRALAIVAQRLQPSTKNSAYAVWLYNSASDAKLLGFVDPPVGKDGRFANFNPLPPGANHFRELIVTRESGNAKKPGQIVLRGELKLK